MASNPLKIEITGNLQNLKSLPDKVRNQIGAGLASVAMEIQARAQNNAVENLNTTGQAKGILASSIHTLIDRENLKAEIGPSVVYGRIHEFGGTIFPVKGKYLTFQLPDGEWRRSVSVTIPARPYLKPAIDDVEPELAIFRKQLEDAVKGSQ